MALVKQFRVNFMIIVMDGRDHDLAEHKKVDFYSVASSRLFTNGQIS